MARFAIWMEGFNINGNCSKASFKGYYEGKTFQEACDNWASESPSRLSSYKSGKYPSYWGCRLFDNEYDARKSFG